MKKLLVGAACAVGLLALPLGTTAASTITCRGFLEGADFGDVVVPAGASCSIGGIGGGTSIRSLRVLPGAGAVEINRTVVRGDIEYRGGVSLTVFTATEVRGSIEVRHAAGSVEIGNANVFGDIRIEQSQLTALTIDLMSVGRQLRIGHTTVSGACPAECTVENTTVEGDVSFQHNRTNGPLSFVRDLIGGELKCTRNEPPPTGSDNTIAERKGQCGGVMSLAAGPEATG